MTEHTINDRLLRPEGRTKREGREVAGVRRLGVLHCHSVITEIMLELSRVVQKKINWKSSLMLQMQPWWYQNKFKYKAVIPATCFDNAYTVKGIGISVG